MRDGYFFWVLVVIVTVVFLYHAIKSRILIYSGASFVIDVRRLIRRYRKYKTSDEMPKESKRAFYNEMGTSISQLTKVYENLERYEFDFAEEDWIFIQEHQTKLNKMAIDVRYEKWLNGIP